AAGRPAGGPRHAPPPAPRPDRPARRPAPPPPARRPARRWQGSGAASSPRPRNKRPAPSPASARSHAPDRGGPGRACRAESRSAWATRRVARARHASALRDRDLGRSLRGLGRGYAAELLVVDQAGDGGVVAAERAGGDPAQVQLAELHVQTLE